MKHKRKQVIKRAQVQCNNGFLSGEMDVVQALMFAITLQKLGNDNIRLIPVTAA